MATIVTRSGKGSPLTNAEVDGNFTNLNTELGTKANASSLATVATSGAYSDLTGKPTNVSSFANDSGYITGITSGNVTTALGFTPYNATNPAGYITGITSGNVTTALGYTPANRAGDNFTGAVGFLGGSAVASNGDFYARRDSGSTGVYYFAAGVDKYLYWDGSSYNFGGAGPVIAPTSFRAPIFYDSNNTAYYVDPNGTSNIGGLTVTNTITGSVSGNAATATNISNTGTVTLASATESNSIYATAPSYTADQPTKLLNFDWYGNVFSLGNIRSGSTPSSGFGVYYTPSGGSRAELMRVDTSGNVLINRTSASGIGKLNVEGGVDVTSGNITVQAGYGIAWRGDQSRIMTPDDNSYGALIRWGATGGCRLFESTTERLRIDGTGSVRAFVDFRAPIFYDSDNTGYYVDPNSTSVFANLNLTGGLAANGSITVGSGATSSYIYMADSDEGTRVLHCNTQRIGFLSQAGSWGAWCDDDGSWRTDGAMYSPVYYDINNTGYYVDPASTSVQYRINVLNGINLTGGIALTSSGATLDNSIAMRLTENYGALWNGGDGTLWHHQVINASMLCGFTGAGANWGSGRVVASNDVRGTLFYDYNNTAYYVDPNSTSVLNNLSVNGGAVYRSDWTTRFQSPSDFVDGTLVTTDIPATAGAGDSFIIEITGKTYDQNNPPVKVVAQGYLYNDTIINYSGISYAGNFASYVKVFQDGGVLKFWWPRISYWNSFNVNVMAMDGPTNNTITRNRVTAIANSTEPTGTKKQQINLSRFMRGDVSATNSVDVRAPIFYDSNDTAYYVDPNSNSNFIVAYANDFYSRGWFRNNNSNTGLYNQETAQHWYSDNGSYWNMGGGNINGQGIRFRDTHQGTIRGYVYYDQSNNVGFLNNEGSWRARVVGGDYFLVEGSSARAQIFYDSNDTNYYLDPASTSNLNRLVLSARNDNYFVGSMAALNTVTNFQSLTNTYGQMTVMQCNDINGFTNAPTGLYQYGAVMSWRTENHSYQMYASHTGDIAYKTQWANDNYSGWLTPMVYGRNGGSSSGKTVYGSIYYDSDNTGYYSDPSSTSRTGMINADNLRTQNNVYIDQQYGSSLVGAYNSTRYQGVYAMGDAYKLAIDGTTAGNLYGIAWAHPNAGGVAGNLNGHGALFLENGGFLAAISGSIRCRDDMRAPIFYDSDNTAFYINPNSTSNVSAMVSYSYQGNGNVGGTGSASWHPSGIYSAGYNWLYGGISAGGSDISSVNNYYGNAYYDSGDTSTYINPNGVSWIKGDINISRVATGGDNNTFGGLELREVSLVGSAQSAATYAPRLNFHWGARAAATIYMDSAGSFVFGGQSDITNNRRSIFCNELYATGNVTAYYSDDRLKTRIGNIENALDIVSSLNGFRYVDNELAETFGYANNGTQLGVSAQEVQKHLPEIVRGAAFDVDHDNPDHGSKTGENYLTVDYSRMVPLLIEAIKELRHEVEMLKK